MNASNFNLFPTEGTPNVVFNGPSSASVKDKYGNFSYRIVKQGDQLIYQDLSGRRLGYINGQGTTFDHSSHILATNPRPDLILLQTR